MSEIDEIKNRVDVVDLISEYIQLKQAGTNWKGLCPFHTEKTPSFMVSKDKQFWHCFGCSEGGDIFTFLQKIEHLDFPEALRILAQKAGVQLKTYDPKIESVKNRLIDINTLAKKFWHKILLESKSAKKARQYLEGRGVAPSTIETFALGYAPNDWDTTSQFLKKKGFNDKEIFLSGLSVKKDKGSGFYDRFRGRIMFPIEDTHGSTIGFSGRTLEGDIKEAKYINTPQTQIYDKSLTLYNFHRAKDFIKQADNVVIVEGQMDVIAAHQAGTKNVVASSGTAFNLKDYQLMKLDRLTKNITFAFDADSAGQAAANRGVALALGFGFNVNIIVLPTGKDPDECIQKDIDGWKKAVAQAGSFIEYFYNKVVGSLDPNDIQSKKQAEIELVPVLNLIPPGLERTHWVQKVAHALNYPEAELREALKKYAKGHSSEGSQPKPASNKSSPEKTIAEQISDRIIGVAISFPDQLGYIIDHVPPELIRGEVNQDLYKELILYYTEASKIDTQTLLERLKKFESTVNVLILLAGDLASDADSRLVLNELNQLIYRLQKQHYTQLLIDIQRRISAAESRGDNEALESLSREFNILTKQMQQLDSQ
ncbi:MAG: DNA primase [Candidatus Buchananbacteria bacterium CG10_big_fil_rev_8_21_14_0_10_42_9]|uniref:DNA primase n=1 Tax=Candidatus Buchananbacteria bacterium CG10_big_fil_rev_8_21_14_0_10_42_9 TaxID=1974526 RepID=A0A2H0W1Z7_9BACT|nr:MAG: DNA primase [Candidatus Buchananbacteria bacterium CG10_big_fil_rev_8_21_14_0_10_42_9]